MADKYVSLTGSDANAGTLAAPYLTWTKGLQNVGLGDTVYIRGGTYTTTVSNPTGITWGTQESERITLMPYADEPVTLKPGSGNFAFHLKDNVAFDYFTLKDITFDGANLNAGAGQLVKIWIQNLTTPTDLSNIIVDGCSFLNAPDHALQIDSESDSCTIQNCTVLNWGNNPGAEVNSNGMYLRGSNHIVQGNVVGATISQAANVFGIRLASNSGDEGNDCDNGLIQRNYIYGSPKGIVFGTGTGMKVINNLIRGCGTLGIQIWSQSGRATPGAKVYHNTLVHATAMTHGIRIIKSVGAVTDTLIRNNIIRRATTAIDVTDDTGTPVTTDNYTGTSPGFANDGGTAIADYILTGAPATVGGGADLRSDVPTDYYGNTRDATPDQGFYELVSPANPEVVVDASFSGNVGSNITFDPQVTDEDSDALTIYIDRRNNTSLTLSFTAGTSTVEGG